MLTPTASPPEPGPLARHLQGLPAPRGRGGAGGLGRGIQMSVTQLHLLGQAGPPGLPIVQEPELLGEIS